MPCHSRMKIIVLQGLLWLCLIGFGCMAASLEPGYLDFDNLPDTNFSCVGKVIGGYYADLETNCQMFHVCTIGQLDEPMDIRFLCLNGTVFDQETRVCERIDEVDCSKSEQFYSLNLELYGNTQPSTLEESPETDPPIIIKSSTTTTTTTTKRPKTTRVPFYTTATAPTVVPTSNSKVISTHHFPVSSAPDIRFNPAEINISLNPGAPPNIRQKPLFHQQIFSNSEISNSNNKKAIEDTTLEPKSIVSYGLTHDKPDVTPSDINFGFTFQQDVANTERSQHYQYQHQQSFRPHPYATLIKTSTYHPQTTRRNNIATTYRHPFFSSIKSYESFRTEKPQRLQLPLPLLPTLPPLTFSSPAPFSLSNHVDAKRYTNEHQNPPRIIISASASVSDASGRRLNYSLGTIGAAQLLEAPPSSYDDYKDHDVGLDPFYHDVPKLKRTRTKRSAPQVKHSEVIRNEQEAVDVLKFLFDWYKDHEKSTTTPRTTISIPLVPETITEINDKLSSNMETPLTINEYDFKESDLFRKSKFNIIGDVLSATENVMEKNMTTTEKIYYKNEDYIDDNYEPLTYQETVGDETKKNISSNDEILTENYHFAPQDIVEETTTFPSTSELISVSNEEETMTYINDDSSAIPHTVTESVTSNSTVLPEEELTTTEKPKNRRRGRGRYRYNNNDLSDGRRKSTEKPPLRHSIDDINTTQTVPITTTKSVEVTTVFKYVEQRDDNSSPSPKIQENSPEITEESHINNESIDITTVSFTDEDNHISTSTILPYEEKELYYVIPNQKNENEDTNTTTNNELIFTTTEKYQIDNTNTTVSIEYTTISSPIYSEDDLTTRGLDQIIVTTEITPSSNSEIYETIPTESSFPKYSSTTSHITQQKYVDEIITTTATSSIEVNVPPVTTTLETPRETTKLTPVETTTSRRRRPRPTRPRSSSPRKTYSRHRFSTDAFTARPNRRKLVQEELIDVLTHRPEEEVPTTDAPLSKSASPTQAELGKEAHQTTPLYTGTSKVRSFIFNCFGKAIDKFYSDPRDCRLFHYCTSGYTRNQLLDMKFVCDLGTYFDDEKLICTKDRPIRCL